MYEDRLMSALFLGLSFIILMISADRAAMPMQLIFMKSTIYWWFIVWQQRTSEVPTLLTKIPISSFFSQSRRSLYFSEFELSLKSKQIVLSCTDCPRLSASALRFTEVVCSLSLFLEIRTTLNPSLIRTQQNPKPMPSVAPVTTAQVIPFYWQQRLSKLRGGRKYLNTSQKKIRINLAKGQAMMRRTMVSQLIDYQVISFQLMICPKYNSDQS